MQARTQLWKEEKQEHFFFISFLFFFFASQACAAPKQKKKQDAGRRPGMHGSTLFSTSGDEDTATSGNSDKGSNGYPTGRADVLRKVRRGHRVVPRISDHLELQRSQGAHQR
ncbi:MAG: hypothetical protein CMM02_00585 [Rhodopirellula sp.]|nr:hypothetical protein [Rhodopirellula sp.]